MPIYFNFINDLRSFKLAFPPDSSINDFRNYQIGFIAACNLAKYFTGSSVFKIQDITTEEETTFTINIYGKQFLTFKITYNRIIMTIRKDKGHPEVYTFYYDFNLPEIYVSLIDMKIKGLHETFEKHKITITKSCNQKIFKFTIPINVSYTINSSLLSSLKGNSTLKDLETLYSTAFLPHQESYDHLDTTSLEVYELYDDQNSTTETLTLQKGQVILYKVEKANTELKMTLTKAPDSEYQVTLNYVSGSLNRDINALIEELREKAMQFYGNPYPRLLEP